MTSTLFTELLGVVIWVLLIAGVVLYLWTFWTKDAQAKLGRAHAFLGVTILLSCLQLYWALMTQNKFEWLVLAIIVVGWLPLAFRERHRAKRAIARGDQHTD